MNFLKTYLLRAVKYLIMVTILFVVVFTVMNITGYSEITPEMFGAFAASSQAQMMLALLLVLVALHPIIGYVKRPFNIDYAANRNQIVGVFAANGYKVESESNNSVTFRASGMFRRATMMGEDAITLDLTSFPHIIEGNRKMVVKICFRLSA